MFGREIQGNFRHVAGAEVLEAPLETARIDAKRFYIFAGGRVYPSVTTVLDASPDAAIVAWKEAVPQATQDRIKKLATDRGTAIHSMAEDYLNNKIVNPNPLLKADFLSIKPLLDRIDNIWGLETVLFSDTYKVAGKTDCIAEFDGILSVIDFKTSSKVKTEDQIQSYFEQTTCYALMAEERYGIKIGQIVVIMSVHQVQSPLLFIQTPQPFVESLKAKIRKFSSENDLSSFFGTGSLSL